MFGPRITRDLCVLHREEGGAQVPVVEQQRGRCRWLGLFFIAMSFMSTKRNDAQRAPDFQQTV
jgi:hypothetical protein